MRVLDEEEVQRVWEQRVVAEGGKVGARGGLRGVEHGRICAVHVIQSVLDQPWPRPRMVGPDAMTKCDGRPDS
eukprot:4228175-Prymnesium_polylepis.1